MATDIFAAAIAADNPVGILGAFFEYKQKVCAVLGVVATGNGQRYVILNRKPDGNTPSLDDQLIPFRQGFTEDETETKKARKRAGIDGVPKTITGEYAAVRWDEFSKAAKHVNEGEIIEKADPAVLEDVRKHLALGKAIRFGHYPRREEGGGGDYEGQYRLERTGNIIAAVTMSFGRKKGNAANERKVGLLVRTAEGAPRTAVVPFYERHRRDFLSGLHKPAV